MERLEARKLLAAYATGSLTEAERQALFQAALEDQELFDELAGEQVLKEVLDEPGARERLLMALEPAEHRAGWWPWAAAAATLAIVIGVVVVNRTQPPPPPQTAQVMKSPEIVSPFPPPVLPVRKTPPQPPPPAAPAPAAELRKDALVDQLQADKPQAAGNVAERARSEAVTISAFGFNYSVLAGSLQIVPVTPGFLSVTANDAILFPGGAVSADMPIRIQIPSEAASLVIRFSRMPGITVSPVRRDETSGTVMQADAPNAGIAIELSLTPATR